MKKPLRVSIELTDNYSVQSFRNFVKMLLSDTDKYELFIISNDDSSAYIMKVGDTLGLNTTNVIVCNFTDDKLQAIRDNNIDIHIDNLQSFVMLVDETTDAYGVLFTYNLNKYYMEPDYIITFKRLEKKIRDEES